MQAKPRQDTAASGRVFEFMERFNRLVATDETVAARLPRHEFELSFDSQGNVFIDGEPLGMTLQPQH